MRIMMCLILLLGTCLHEAAAGPRPQRGHGGDIPWITLDAAEAKPRAQPMLVYFGAEWCAPCKTLETQVFNQSDVTAAMAGLLPVYIDGDRDGASQAMERFKVAVFPTLLVIDAEGKERGRFVGSSEKAEVLAFLASSTVAETPAFLLGIAADGKTLSASQWRTLATIHVLDAWDALYLDDAAKQAAREKRENLARAAAAARADRAAPTTVADALALKLLVIDAIDAKPKEPMAMHRSTLSSVLAKPELSLALRAEVIGSSENFLDYLEPDAGPNRTALAEQLMRALERIYDQPGTTASSKLEILGTELVLLPMTSKDIDADKTRFAERVEGELKLATTTAERLAIAQQAARVLRRTGRELRAEAVLRETLKAAPDAYYLLGTLAAYAQLRGDADAQLELSERAYRLSLDRTSGLGYGSAWLKALIAHSPKETTRIAIAAEEVLGHAIAEGDVYLGWGDDTMKDIANTLGAWMATGDKPGAPMSARILARFKAVCDSVRDTPAQAEACQGNLVLLAKPEAEPANS